MNNNNSIFGQMLQLISRYEFQKAVNEYKSEKRSKGFSSWTHFVSMLQNTRTYLENLLLQESL
jgi:hypothetical protein